MRTVSEHIREHALDVCGCFSMKPAPAPAELRWTQWSDEYETFRRNRMVMGFFRYGDINRQDLDSYDLPEEAIRRIRLYQRNRNLEHLVDAGNMLMLAYMQGKRHREQFNSIDDGEHAKPKG